MNELIEQIGGRERLKCLSDCAPNDASGHVTYREVNLMASALLAVLGAQQSPVWGQARFKGGEWSSCTAEHAAMVMASPDEWAGYECRYLYATPPAASVPDGWKLAPVEPNWSMIDAAINQHEGDAFLPVSLYKAMIAAAPAPGGNGG